MTVSSTNKWHEEEKKKHGGRKNLYKFKDTHKSKVKCDFPISKHYKATVIKTVRYWRKDRHKNQWKRIEARNKPPRIWAINF